MLTDNEQNVLSAIDNEAQTDRENCRNQRLEECLRIR